MPGKQGDRQRVSLSELERRIEDAGGRLAGRLALADFEVLARCVAPEVYGPLPLSEAMSTQGVEGPAFSVKDFTAGGVGCRLRAVREARGWSRKRLARAARVHVSAVSLWERGRFEPKASSLARLARALAVTADDLLGRPAVWA